MSSTSHNHFEQEHARIGTGMQAHLLALVGADFAEALQHFDHWQQELMQHIAIENEQLLPHLPADARWPARMYELEHERITLLADEYRARLAQVAQQPPSDEPARRQTVLDLLDATHALRHLLEHHNQREEMALAQELPLDLQQAVWPAQLEHPTASLTTSITN